MKDKRTYASRRDELIRAVAKRRRVLKKRAIVYKGGNCQVCGYNRYQGALDLHHINPAEKAFGIAEKGYTRSWEKLRIELDKCILVCANCHREIEAGITQLPGEIQVETRGEIGETLGKRPGQSRAKLHPTGEGVETIPIGSTCAHRLLHGSASHPSAYYSG